MRAKLWKKALLIQYLGTICGQTFIFLYMWTTNQKMELMAKYGLDFAKK
jgi:hypothetical protein